MTIGSVKLSNMPKSISDFYSTKKFFAVLIVLLALSALINSFVFFGVGAFIATALYIIRKFVDTNIYISRGFVKCKMEDYEGAIADFDKVIELNPKYVAAYNNRGVAKNAIGDYEEAIADFDKAIELEPNRAFAYGSRGAAKGAMGDYKGAIADYDKAVELGPKNAIAYGSRGFAKSEIEDYKGAIADFDKAMTLDPRHADFYKEKIQNIKNEIYKRSPSKFKMKDKKMTELDLGAFFKSERGDYKGAIADLDKVIELDPKYGPAYCSRGSAKYSLGNYEEAVADLDKAMELGLNHALAYHNRGITKVEIGDYRGAIADFDRAMELNPKNAGLYRELINTTREELDNYFKLTQPTLQSQLRTKLHKIVDILKKSLFHIANLLVFGIVFEFWDCSNANWMMSSGALLFFSCYIIYWPYYRIHGEYDWTTCEDFYPEPFLIKVSTLFCVWGLIMLLAGGSIWLWCPS